MPGFDPKSFASVFKGVLDITQAVPSKPTYQLDEEAVLDNLEGECETIQNLEEDDVLHITELFNTLNLLSVR